MLEHLHFLSLNNYFIDKWFYVQVAAVIVLYRLINRFASAKVRSFALAAFSVLFLLRIKNAFVFLPVVCVYIAVLLALGYLLFKSEGQKKSFFLIVTGVILAVLALIIFKYENYTNALFGEREVLVKARLLLPVGLSYMTFRTLDFMMMMKSKRVKQFSVLSSIAYFFFFPAFIAGPINRYRLFVKDGKKPDDTLTFERFRNNLFRISAGIIKILFLAKWAYFNSILAPEYFEAGASSFGRLALGVYAYLLYIYWDFSGYTDCAIAIADFFGIKLPENFNWPIISSSIQDFWNRWHISLSHWCRDYMFFTQMKFISDKFPKLPQIIGSCCSIFITFAVIGAWHGDKLHWFLYGCYHGVGLAVFMLYNYFLKTFCPELGEKLQLNMIYRIICIIVTLNFVSWGLLLTIDFEVAAKLLSF